VAPAAASRASGSRKKAAATTIAGATIISRLRFSRARMVCRLAYRTSFWYRSRKAFCVSSILA
jgi:hypothetical protein